MSGLEDDVGNINRLLGGETVHCTFLRPLLACAVAVLAKTGDHPSIHLDDAARHYADTTGLSSILNLDRAGRSALGGATYSPLTELLRPETVDASASAIRKLLASWLPGNLPVATRIGHVLWEAMDNVTAHSRGLGFAMAQTYPNLGWLEIAVGDGGMGMLRKLRQAGISDVTSDIDAIQWCLAEGNSTAMEDSWAQRSDWGDEGVPGTPVQARSDGTSHAGLGLTNFRECVEGLGGVGLIWSGRGSVRVGVDHSAATSRGAWGGVLIVARLPLGRPVVQG